MAFKLSMLLDADAKGAKAELAGTQKAVDGVRQASGKMNRTHKASAVDLQTLAQSANAAEAEARQLAAAERLAAKEAAALTSANRRAAAMTGNLGAQFNDIGVMLAAGQSPLQLALQQGTQITQVIGPLGAGGAVSALGAAFTSLFNPVSLITIGSIAAGAAMFQWLTSAGPEAVKLEDVIGNLSDAVNIYQKALRAVQTPMDEMNRKFGAQAGFARAAQQAILDLARQKALDEVDAAQKKLAAQLPSLRGILKVIGVRKEERKAGSSMLPALVHEVNKLKKEFGLTEQQARNMGSAIDNIGKAKGPKELSAALDKMRALIVETKDASGKIPPAFKDVAKAVSEGQLSVLTLTNAINAKHSESLASAKELLKTLSEQNAIRAAANMFGEKSAAVALLRKQGERAILEKQLAELDVSESIKNEIRAAWEAGKLLNQTTMSDGIKDAANEAKRIADEINRAVRATQQLKSTGANALADAKLRLKFANDPIELARQLGETRFRRGQTVLRRGAGPAELSRLNALAKDYGNTLAQIAKTEKDRTDLLGKGKGQTRGTQKQVDALSKLIEKEQLQIALLRETDPVQKEMLRNREALAGATDRERAAVKGIIAERINEQKALERLQGKQELFKSTAYNAFDELIFQGKKAGDVIDDIGKSLLRATLQAALLGTGPLGSILGGGHGGLLGSVARVLFPSPTPALAGGGLLHGPGSGTSDDILMFGSSGEFMMNAKATNKYRHLLEVMNGGGTIPALAAGGPVTPSYSNGSQSLFDMRPQITIENHSSANITQDRQDSVDSSGRRKTKLVLADAVGEALTMPGGGAKRAMRKNYGLRPSGVQR